MTDIKVGALVKIKTEARWRNFGEPTARCIPAGTLLKLESKRPEGWYAVIQNTGDVFFLFNKYLESAYKENK